MIVQCSWKVSDNRPVSDAITWAGESESANVEDEVMAENCLMLEAPDKGDGAYPTVPACQLLISCQPPKQISRISVLCEARVMEVYGHHGEYLKTIRNELLEEVDDMMVFKGEIFLEKPLTLCSIKFAYLRSPSEMWLYGIKVNLATAESTPTQLAIPLEAVEQRLADMGLVLSDKAEAFKQLVERCQKSPLFAQQDIGYIIANLQLLNLVKHKSPSPNGMETLNKVENQVNKNELIVRPSSGLKSSACTSPMVFERKSNSTQTDEDYTGLEDHIKTYINEKFSELNDNLWNKINMKLRETEAKLFCKLDAIESFIKPQGTGDPSS